MQQDDLPPAAALKHKPNQGIVPANPRAQRCDCSWVVPLVYIAVGGEVHYIQRGRGSCTFLGINITVIMLSIDLPRLHSSRESDTCSPKAVGGGAWFAATHLLAEGAATWPQTVLTRAHLQTFIMMSHLAGCSIKAGNYKLARLQAPKPCVHIWENNSSNRSLSHSWLVFPPGCLRTVKTLLNITIY